MPEAVSEVAEAILIAHQRMDAGSCVCGWSELGKSHPAHQVRMLIEAGAVATDGMPQECREETYSWRHFTPQQMDGYWIRCTLLGLHSEHEDEHTGLTWIAQNATDSGSDPSGGTS